MLLKSILAVKCNAPNFERYLSDQPNIVDKEIRVTEVHSSRSTDDHDLGFVYIHFHAP